VIERKGFDSSHEYPSISTKGGGEVITERRENTMGKVKVGVAGFGVIGQRLADGVASRQDMELVGVADVAPTLPVRALRERGMPYKPGLCVNMP
jgi:phosphoglycerate dehydrogenase-like enzyme